MCLLCIEKTLCRRYIYIYQQKNIKKFISEKKSFDSSCCSKKVWIFLKKASGRVLKQKENIHWNSEELRAFCPFLRNGEKCIEQSEKTNNDTRSSNKTFKLKFIIVCKNVHIYMFSSIKKRV